MVPPRAFAFVGFFAMILASPVKRQDDGRKGILNWVCNEMPEVCNNMCYGAYCRGVTTSLTWDKPSDAVSNARSMGAGCGNNNRCNADNWGKPGFQCDEYPFKSTSNADHTIAVNRCVPQKENSRQGALLGNFYNSKGRYKGVGLDGNTGDFRISFANAGNVPYCASDGSPDCTNDGNQYDRNGKADDTKKKRDVSSPNLIAKRYLLSRGEEITVPGGAEIGDVVLTPRQHNSTSFNELIARHEHDDDQGLEQFDYLGEHLYVDEDEIVEALD